MSNLDRYRPQLPTPREDKREMERIDKLAQEAIHRIGMANAYGAYKTMDTLRTIEKLTDGEDDTNRTVRAIYSQRTIESVERATAQVNEKYIRELTRRLR